MEAKGEDEGKLRRRKTSSPAQVIAKGEDEGKLRRRKTSSPAQAIAKAKMKANFAEGKLHRQPKL
jgi:hypothetical protein